ncbi:MAG: homocitrate synthase/isopropylmalate synthase family protein, partial [Desulfuromonadales bacterium]
NYEGYDPAEVGLIRHMVIGKHSGRHALQDRLEHLGIKLGGLEADRLLELVRHAAQSSKRLLTDHELVRLSRDRRMVA